MTTMQIHPETMAALNGTRDGAVVQSQLFIMGAIAGNIEPTFDADGDRVSVDRLEMVNPDYMSSADLDAWDAEMDERAAYVASDWRENMTAPW